MLPLLTCRIFRTVQTGRILAEWEEAVILSLRLLESNRTGLQQLPRLLRRFADSPVQVWHIHLCCHPLPLLLTCTYLSYGGMGGKQVNNSIPPPFTYEDHCMWPPWSSPLLFGMNRCGRCWESNIQG